MASTTSREAALERRKALTSGGKKVCVAQLKLRTMPFSEVPLAPIVRKRAEEVGLIAAMAAQG